MADIILTYCQCFSKSFPLLRSGVATAKSSNLAAFSLAKVSTSSPTPHTAGVYPGLAANARRGHSRWPHRDCVFGVTWQTLLRHVQMSARKNAAKLSEQ